MSTNPTFPPIESPLDLSPEEFVAAAKERGLRFARHVTWDRFTKRGCALGLAAVLRDPEFAKRKDVCHSDTGSVLGLTDKELEAVMDGFDESFSSHVPRFFTEEYEYGRAVARAAGLD